MKSRFRLIVVLIGLCLAGYGLLWPDSAWAVAPFQDRRVDSQTLTVTSDQGAVHRRDIGLDTADKAILAMA